MSKETKQEEIPKEEVTEDGKLVLAPSLKRILAFSLDFLFIALFTQAFLPLVLPEGWDEMLSDQLLWALVPLYIMMALLVILKDQVQGRSVGKRILNLHVAQVQEGFPNATGKQLLIRNLWLLLLPVEAFKMTFDSYCRRYGDHMAGTVVMDLQKPPAVRQLTTKVVGVMLVISVLWSVYIYMAPLKIQKSRGYQIASQAAFSDPEILGILGGIDQVGYWPDVTYEQEREIYILQVTGKNGEERRVQVVLDNMARGRKVLGVMLLDLESSEETPEESGKKTD